MYYVIQFPHWLKYIFFLFKESNVGHFSTNAMPEFIMVMSYIWTCNGINNIK